MSKTHVVVFLSLIGASVAVAQPGPDRPMGRGAPAAQMLLAHTGELELTDQQVVRLAAIARRAEARRRTMRASMDSARARFGSGGAPSDSVARRQFRDRMRADMDRVRDQLRADQRDAIAVLTPDQQERAWDLVASRGRDRRMGAMRERGMRERGMRGRGMRERGTQRGPAGPGVPGRAAPRPSQGSEG